MNPERRHVWKRFLCKKYFNQISIFAIMAAATLTMAEKFRMINKTNTIVENKSYRAFRQTSVTLVVSQLLANKKTTNKVNSRTFEQTALLRRVALRWLNRTAEMSKRKAIEKWKWIAVHDSHYDANENKYSAQVDTVIKMLSSSSIGNRTMAEKNVLKTFLLADQKPSFALFRKLSSYEMDKMCNEVDFHSNKGRSIIFLQGDISDCSFIILRGRVDLFHEKNKDREKEILAEFSASRGKFVADSVCNHLGTLLKSLPIGSVFGEASTSSGNLRSCSAIASPGTLVLVVFPGTYNDVLRKYRLSEDQLATACALLRELTFFQQFNYNKIMNIATTLRHRHFTAKTTIVEIGQDIKILYLIMAGAVKVFPFEIDKLSIRKPNFAVAELGRGMIIGERELHKNINKFQMTYVCDTECELFEMDVQIYEENACSTKVRNSVDYMRAEQLEGMIYKQHHKRILACKKLVVDNYTNDGSSHGSTAYSSFARRETRKPLVKVRRSSGYEKDVFVSPSDSHKLNRSTSATHLQHSSVGYAVSQPLPRPSSPPLMSSSTLPAACLTHHRLPSPVSVQSRPDSARSASDEGSLGSAAKGSPNSKKNVSSSRPSTAKAERPPLHTHWNPISVSRPLSAKEELNAGHTPTYSVIPILPPAAPAAPPPKMSPFSPSLGKTPPVALHPSFVSSKPSPIPANPRPQKGVVVVDFEPIPLSNSLSCSLRLKPYLITHVDKKVALAALSASDRYSTRHSSRKAFLEELDNL